MTVQQEEGDNVAILDDGAREPEGTGGLLHWLVLIADDDNEVHEATVFALANATIEGRRLKFLHAYSAGETEALLREHADVAVLLLDVVMESEDAGLALIGRIRGALAQADVRIILRTGQPGYAPELEVIRQYDINDYKTKSELTLTRLITVLTTAIRSYRQILTIAASHHGLELIVDAATDLFSRRDMAAFGDGLLTQAFALAGGEPSGLLCVAAGGGRDAPDQIVVTHAVGRFAECCGRRLDALAVPEVGAQIQACLDGRRNLYAEDAVLLYLAGTAARRGVAYLATGRLPGDLERRLLDVFSANASVGLENVNLFQDLDAIAYRDRLTGLPNRTRFIAEIDQWVFAGGDSRAGCAVALLDIDHFSETNDALGHRIGDELLLLVAQRLQHACQPGVMVARVGPDVFGLLGARSAIEAARLLAMIDSPFRIEGYSLGVKATMGITDIAIGDGGGLEALRAATIALNMAKRGGRGYCAVFTADMAAEREQRLTLLNELRSALTERRGLELYYQPQISFATRRVVGAEALLRWRRENGEFVPPDRFIALAEYSGLIVELGAWVFETAVAQLAEWDRCALHLPRMSINVSLVQFRAAEFLPMARDCVQRAAIPAGRIELEITESMAMLEADRVGIMLDELKQLGFLIAIDDFGTGFSSLSYLHELPIDRLKIDRAFIRSLSEQARGKSIARMVVGLGHSLGLAVIAEGVETEAQAAILRAMQCDEVQGFLYGKPMPAAQFKEWHAAWLATPASS